LPQNTSGTNICLLVIRQTDEADLTKEYDHEVKQDFLFTNTLSDSDGDSAYIEWVKDEEDTTVFSDELVYAIVLRLAAELASRIVKDSLVTRNKLMEEYEKYTLKIMQGISRSQQYQEDEPPESNFSWLGGRTA
jgi:hypothetical protein